MQKIPSLYTRDPEDMARVTRDVNPRCQWVIDGEGTATVKWDGTCVRLDDNGQWWTRHQVKPGKATPDQYIPVEHDPVTGRTQGWIPATTSGYAKFLAEAIDTGIQYTGHDDEFLPGTYELVGPRIGANPHNFATYTLLRHGDTKLFGVPTQYDALASWLRAENERMVYLEGVVWHHPDGVRLAKIKTRDFRVTANA